QEDRVGPEPAPDIEHPARGRHRGDRRLEPPHPLHGAVTVDGGPRNLKLDFFDPAEQVPPMRTPRSERLSKGRREARQVRIDALDLLLPSEGCILPQLFVIVHDLKQTSRWSRDERADARARRPPAHQPEYRA